MPSKSTRMPHKVPTHRPFPQQVTTHPPTPQFGGPILPPQKSALLNKLPAEIRSSIYRYALVEDEYVDVGVLCKRGCDEPGLLFTCKQVRTEAYDMFYKENTFRISVEELAPLGSLKAHRCRLITRLELESFPHDKEPNFAQIYRDIKPEDLFRRAMKQHAMTALPFGYNARKAIKDLRSYRIDLEVVKVLGPEELHDFLDVKKKLWKISAEHVLAEYAIEKAANGDIRWVE